ncbi:methylmalonyl-CoA mutase, partial [Streptomyces sp. SID11233]|nr:methylmalonyl-CoA mutase [Streptomyces sp. SID11233]
MKDTLDLSRTTGTATLALVCDAPTRTGFDPGDPAAAGAFGREGLALAHLGDVRRLFDGVP